MTRFRVAAHSRQIPWAHLSPKRRGLFRGVLRFATKRLDKTDRMMATILGTSAANVHRIRQQLGVPRLPRPRKLRPEQAAAYFDYGKDDREVATHFGVSRWTIGRMRRAQNRDSAGRRARGYDQYYRAGFSDAAIALRTGARVGAVRNWRWRRNLRAHGTTASAG